MGKKFWNIKVVFSKLFSGWDIIFTFYFWRIIIYKCQFLSNAVEDTRVEERSFVSCFIKKKFNKLFTAKVFVA